MKIYYDMSVEPPVKIKFLTIVMISSGNLLITTSQQVH